jgi:hypothetical protein
MDMVGDELRVLKGEREGIASTTAVGDHDQLLWLLCGDRQELGANCLDSPAAASDRDSS